MSHLTSAVLVLLLLVVNAANAEEKDVRAIVESNFQSADADGDGSLSSTEFRSLIDANAENEIGRAAMVKRFGAYKRAFKTADRDGNGGVTWAEIIENASQQAR